MNDFFSLTNEEREYVIKRFEANVKKGKDDECWMWTGTKYNHGYGRLRIKPKNIDSVAHRFAWMINYKCPIPADLACCHTCDVKACVNPRHIVIATIAENNRDTVQRGRWKPKGGKTQGKTRVPFDKRLDIVREYMAGASARQLAKKYSIKLPTLIRWAHQRDMTLIYGKQSLAHRLFPWHPLYKKKE